jgi:RAP1 GTPase activating protein 1
VLLGNTKGTHSVFTHFHGFDVMFHVSTYLPYNPLDEKKVGALWSRGMIADDLLHMQLQRSRVIGNDITMIIFQEGDTRYEPTTMTGGVSRTTLD